MWQAPVSGVLSQAPLVRCFCCVEILYFSSRLTDVGQTERFGVRMQQRHFSLRFFLFAGLLSLLLCVLTLTAPAALALSGKIREVAVPTAFTSGLFGITAGPDGNLWFTEEHGNNIGRISPTPKHKLAEFAIPTAGSLPFGITAGPDGNLWFTEFNGNNIGQLR